MCSSTQAVLEHLHNDIIFIFKFHINNGDIIHYLPLPPPMLCSTLMIDARRWGLAPRVSPDHPATGDTPFHVQLQLHVVM